MKTRVNKSAKGTRPTPAKPDVIPANKAVRPHRYDRRSVQEYEDEGLEQAVNFFAKQSGTFRKHIVDASEVRAAIERLPADTKLQTTMADFWLRLSRSQGQRRRRNRPPPSPFVKSGRNQQAQKEEIEEWDRLWVSQDAARVFAKSGSWLVRSIGKKIKAGLPWLTDEEKSIFGCVAELPLATFEQAMKQPENLGVAWMSVEQALRGRWRDAEEQTIWFDRYKSATSALLSELQASLLARVLEK